MFEHLRELYGEVYVTSLPDGNDIPWKPLSYGDFVYYTELFQEGRLSATILEDEIFRKCVVNKAIVNRLDGLSAGTVQTVVAHIMQKSGPSTVDEFNTAFDDQRKKIDNPLHFVVTIICRAFPSYRPEEVYDLDYETMMLRLAQSEKMLLDAKILSEPIVLYSEGQQPQSEKRIPPPELKSAWEASMKFKDLNPKSNKSITSQHQSPSPIQKKKNIRPPQPMPSSAPQIQEISKPSGWDMKKSPVLQKRANIDIPKENEAVAKASSGARSGWDMVDEPLIRKQVVDDAKVIYKDLLEELAKTHKKEDK